MAIIGLNRMEGAKTWVRLRFFFMSHGTQKYKLTEVKRAVRALQEAGVKIARVAFESGRFEVITADGQAEIPNTETAAERWLREQNETRS